MKLLTFRAENTNELRLGVKTSLGIIDLTAAVASLGGDGIPTSMEALLAGGKAAQHRLATFVDDSQAHGSQSPWLLDEADLPLGPVIPNPGKIIGVGLNYRQHALESGLAVPGSPVLFSKFNNALAAAGEPIPLPPAAEQYDYEVELLVIIGRQARYVSETKALDYVAGYATANDLSARDLQNRTSQWLLGKTLAKFLPAGPYLVTADEVPDPQSLPLRCWVNGELRQDSSTADMIFPVAYLISYISQYMTLEPGDLISTGTPQGVIAGMKDKVWLRPGDEVTVEVAGLGRLTNRMVSES